ncbi:peroxiredoxin-like family protein [Granulicella mallensis]|uniref:thioredoxin-dependent peroxiredoxin n=1 Tax=Granulicella mallensis TaxID=940614 RepID=A0A7W7ZTJ2_9BACT|nr:peroxiredoxin-like family protein [Granulicella mallensis]MBB5065006.1 peroxiredoxin [Granulicella mallensis]
MERVRSSDVLDHALKVGDAAPEFTLPDAFGHEVSLGSLLAEGPVVISFYRGEWCPYCNLELRELQAALPKMQALGAKLVAISPEKPDGGIIATEKNQLTFPILSDFKNKLARQFGIVFQVGDGVKDLGKSRFNNDLELRNGEGSYQLPVPATYVIDASGIIRFSHVDADYMTGRVEAETVVAALELIAHPVVQ